MIRSYQSITHKKDQNLGASKNSLHKNNGQSCLSSVKHGKMAHMICQVMYTTHLRMVVTAN